MFDIGMGIFGNFLFRSLIGLKKRLIEYLGGGAGHVWGVGHGRNVDNENI